MNKIRKFYKGKTVWVTGASSGIGEALVHLLSELEANIIISSRSERGLDVVAKSCQQNKSESKIIVAPLDLENFFKLSKRVSEIELILKGKGLKSSIDVLINNAGISSRGGALETDASTLVKVMATNFYGAVELTRAVIPGMINQGFGNIAVVSSVQGKIGLPYRTSYSASKHAVQGYFDGLRAEVADRGVRVTLVSPGYVATSLSVNAVNSDGTPYGRTDDATSKGMKPDVLAREILYEISQGSPDVVIADTQAVLAIHLKTLFPGLLSWIMRKRARSSKAH